MVGREVRTAEIEPFAPERDDRYSWNVGEE